MSETAFVITFISICLIIIADVIFIYCALVISSRSSKEEEEYERTRKIHKQGKSKDLL